MQSYGAAAGAFEHALGGVDAVDVVAERSGKLTSKTRSFTSPKTFANPAASSCGWAMLISP